MKYSFNMWSIVKENSPISNGNEYFYITKIYLPETNPRFYLFYAFSKYKYYKKTKLNVKCMFNKFTSSCFSKYFWGVEEGIS